MKIATIMFMAGALLIGASGPAYAGLALNSAYSFTVWSGSYSSLGINGNADLTDAPAGPPSVTFTYTGPLNFAATGSDSAGSFFGNDASLISSFTTISGQFTSLSNFLTADTLSSSGLSGSSLVTYMEITGTYTASAATPVTIRHDAGASLYVGILDTALIASPTPAGVTTNTAVLPTTGGADSNFMLVYVAANGVPSILQVDQPVPEPGSLVLLGSAMIGLGLVRRRSLRRRAGNVLR